MRLHFVDYLSARVSSKEGRKLSLVLHRRLALTALVAPATFLPGVHGVIAAEVAAPGPESRGRRWRAGLLLPYGQQAGRQPHRVHSSTSFLAPTLLLPCFTATAFHSSTWMSQLMLSHPSLASGIALLLSLGRFQRGFKNLTQQLHKSNKTQVR